MTNLIDNIVLWVCKMLSAWANALLSVLPDSIRPYFHYKEPGTTVVVENGDDVPALLSDVKPSAEVDFRLTEGIVLQRQFMMPLAAKGDAVKIVRLELERIMPLPADQLVHAFTLDTQHSKENALVTLTAARKSLADAIFLACEQRRCSVGSIGVAGENDAPTVFKFPELQRRSFSRAGVVLAGLVSLLLILGLLPGMYNQRLEQAIAAIDEQVSTTRRQTEAIAGLQRQVRVMQGLFQSVQERRQASSALELLNELTAVSPDDVVFEDVRLDSGRLFVTGIAVAPENWVLTLEDSETFSNVTLSSVIGLEDNLSKRFEVRFDITHRQERQE